MPRNRLTMLLGAVLAIGGLLWFFADSERRGPDVVVPDGSRVDPADHATSVDALEIVPPARIAEGDEGRAVAVLDGLELENGVQPRRGALLVVGLDGHTPQPGFALRALLCTMYPYPKLLCEAALETDKDGRADLAEALAKAPAAQFVRFFPTLDPGLRLAPFEVSIDALSERIDAPTVLQIEERGTARIHAQMIDAATGKPLPNVALRTIKWFDLPADAGPLMQLISGGFMIAHRVYGPDDCEWVIGDDEGRFTTANEYPSGRIGFLTIDRESADLQHDASAAVAFVPLEVPVGALVRLDFAPGGRRDASDYVAGIWRAPEELVATQGVHEYPSPWAPGGGRRAGMWGNAAPVHGGSDPYVQLMREQCEEPLPSFLFLLSRDGKSFGHAPIESLEGYRDDPLHVELREYLALRCVIVWPEGFDADSWATVVLRLASESESESEPRDVSLDRIDGEAETVLLFQALTPGDWELRIEGEELETLTLGVALPYEGSVVLRPRMAPPVALYDVSVRVVTASGRPLDGEGGRAKLRGVHLWPTGEVGGASQFGAVKWSGGTGTVHFDNVRAGTHGVRVAWMHGVHGVDQATVKITVPGPVTELRIRDDAPTIRVEVRVIDPPERGHVVVSAWGGAAGSAASETFRFHAGRERVQLSDGRDALVFMTGPLDADLQVSLRYASESHRTVHLEEAHIAPPGRDGVRRVEILSRPGWGAQCTVWEISEGERGTRERCAGVTLTLDGVAQVPTDERGRLFVSLDAQPEVLGVATPGWRLVTRRSLDDWGSVFAATGAFTVEDGFLDVFLVRD